MVFIDLVLDTKTTVLSDKHLGESRGIPFPSFLPLPFLPPPFLPSSRLSSFLPLPFFPPVSVYLTLYTTFLSLFFSHLSSFFILLPPCNPPIPPPPPPPPPIRVSFMYIRNVAEALHRCGGTPVLLSVCGTDMSGLALQQNASSYGLVWYYCSLTWD